MERQFRFRKILDLAGPLGLLISALFYLPAAQAAISPSERQVLLNLYYDTNGDAWADNTEWNGPPGSECFWLGITCDASQSTIISIDLDNNLLTGSLPQIGALSHLQYLNIGNDGPRDPNFPNLVTGEIPPLDGLRELRVFIANNQSLTGQIPPLLSLSNLSRFEVPHNRLSGSIPAIADLGNLTYFDASYNQLTGTIPDIHDLANVNYFRLAQNQLTGGVPAISHLSNLSVFDVSGNRLTGSIPLLTGTVHLQIFSVGNNLLTGSIPPLSGLSSLQYFFAARNYLTGGIPDISSLLQLSYFRIEGNQLTGSVPAPTPQLGAFSAGLCPNQVTPASDPPSAIDLAWDNATGFTPWSQKCSQTPVVTAITASTDRNPSIVGQPVTFIASVHSGVSPSGTVTFSAVQLLHEGQTILCADIPLNNGSANCTYSAFAAGTSNVVTATYSGDAANASSSDSTVDQAVYYAITESTSANPSQQGQAIDIVATVGGGKSTDTITFLDGIVTLCASVPVVLVGGTTQAHCVRTLDRLGDHPLTVRDDQGPLGRASDHPLVQNVIAATGFDADQFALTGSWFNAATSGQGLTIQVYPDFSGSGDALLAGGWFTYDASGNQRWLFLQGGLTSAHGPTYDMGVYTSSGGNFNAAPVTTAVNYGSATMTFYDCGHATLHYTLLDGRDGTIPYTRLTSPSACTTAVPAVVPQSLPPNYADVLHSGNWFNPATSGQGLVIDIVPAQSAFVLTWYTYAPQSEGLTGETAQRWFSIQSAYTPGDLNLTGLPIYVTSGGIFNDSTPISYSQVGTADVNFISCNKMSLHYTFTSGEYAGDSGTIDEQTIAPVAGCQ